MPKFARSNIYNGRQSNQSWTGTTRAATINEAEAGESDQIYISPKVLSDLGPTFIPDASTTVKGILYLATNAEAVTGTDAAKAIVPASLTARLAAPGAIGGTTPAAGSFTTLGSTGASSIGSTSGNVALGNSAGQIGFFGSAGATKVTQAAVTNSVTSGGSANVIADFNDLTTYATDAPTIRDDIYQLAAILTNVVGALRSYGLLV